MNDGDRDASQLKGDLLAADSVVSGVEARLRVREAQLRAVLESVGECFYALDKDWRFTVFNRASEQYFGVSRDLILGQNLWDVFKIGIGTEYERCVRAAMDEGIAGALVSPSLFRPGRFGDLRVAPMDGGGITVSITDITERKAAEDQLRATSARLEFLDRLGSATVSLADADAVLAVTTRLLGEYLNVSNCAYADMDEDENGFNIRGDWAAPGSQSIVGHYSLADFGKLAVSRLSAGLPLIVNDNLSELAPEEAATFQNIGIAATICMPLQKEGRLSALMAIHDKVPRVWTDEELELLREVTSRSWAHVERVAATAELRASEARLRELNVNLERKVTERALARGRTWQVSPEIMGVLNHEGYFEQSNPAWQTVLGWSEHEISKTVFFDFIHPDDMASTQAAWSDAIEFGLPALRFENRYRAKDGGWHWLSWVAVPDDDKVYCSARDITDIKSREAELETARIQLAEMQKMETIGQLSGGIAHDFNNLLTPIVGSLDMLHRKYSDDERTARMLSGALQAADRARVLVSRLLTFARRQHLEAQVVDVASLAEGMVDLIQRTIGPQIEVVIDVSRDIPPAIVDPHQLELALLNMCVNARDAMPGGGKLTIASDCVDESDPDQLVLPEGNFVRLCVKDTGHGMDAETLRRATEPFYSTKGVGKGTGLGLSMVQGLAAQSGGGLHINSKPGEGTIVTIWLPAAEEAAITTDGGPGFEAIAPSRALSVLLVDDEELVLAGNAEMLESLGHRVDRVQSGAAALSKLRSNEKFDLLLTDHMMPNMTGLELIAKAKLARPDLPSALVTGFAGDAGRSEGVLRLAKPFRLADLARFLDRIMVA